MDELQHHGIKGMRWGVRRYQNADGSMTPDGKKRYSGYDPNATVKKSKQTKSYEKLYKKTGDEGYKKLAELSYKGDVFDKTATKQQKKEQKAWDDKVDKEWLDAYNRAADKINEKIGEFNAKWDKKGADLRNPDLKVNKEYTKAYVNMWNDIYSNELNVSFGKSPHISAGREWCDRVWGFMDADINDL